MLDPLLEVGKNDVVKKNYQQDEGSRVAHAEEPPMIQAEEDAVDESQEANYAYEQLPRSGGHSCA